MFVPLVRRLCAAWLLAGVPALAHAQVVAPPPTQNFLWEVTSMTNKVYLYGTIHAGKKDWYPLPAAVEKAFDDSRVIVVEADITNLEAMSKSGSSMSYTPPDNLAKHVKPADYARLKKLAGKYSLPEDMLAQMKPFMAGSLLVFSEWGRLGYQPAYGIDLYVIRKAKNETKPLVEIEGIAAQMDLMDSLTDAENEAAFVGTLTALESGISSEQITGMVNAWQSGDPQLLLEVARKYNTEIPGAAAFEEKFIWARHEGMVKKIEGYLNETKSRHFIAVGALHLAGPKGVVEMLKKRGYVVRQL